MAESAVQSVERAFGLLELMADRPRGIGLVELSELAGLHKSTTHRLLSCLRTLGYVVQDSNSGHYRLTYRLLSLSNRLLEDMDVLSVAKPHLDALADKAGETVHLLVPEGSRGVYIYKSEPAACQSQMRSKVGLRVPLVCTAAGKAMLATWERERVRAVWDAEPPQPMTEKTITALPDLMRQLTDVAKRGWAVDDEENELGVFCVGAAMLGFNGAAVAAMSISGNTARMTGEWVAELTPLLLACRDNIHTDLGLSKKK